MKPTIGADLMNPALPSHTTEVEALRLALRQAQEGISTRDRFLALLSHELRSPMSGIQSWAYVLEHTIDGQAAAPVLQALAGIKSGVQQQVRLIDDLLDATQVMSGQIVLAFQPLQPRIALDMVIEGLAEELKAKDIVIEREYAVSDALILGDAKRVAQVLRNLLVNAIRFSTSGAAIRLSIALTEGEIQIRVIDHGRGISLERLAALRGTSTDGIDNHGAALRSTGLKLMLSQRLLALQHGRLEINSAGLDQGAEFAVYFPVAMVSVV